MTEIMINTAEEEFLHGHTVSAFKWATMAQELDPFFGSVNQYVEGYRIHIAALKKHHNGEIDWYNILGVKEDKCVSILSQSITHQYAKLSELINPDVHCSTAAPKAFKLLTTAWEILGEPDKRRAYHNRVGLPLPKSEKELHQGTKAEIMIDTAEKEFLHGHTVSAFKWATMAQKLDPFFGSVNQYVEGYRIHIAALKKHRNGEIDWYNILGIKEDKCLSILSQSITHQYVKLSELINPDVHCSTAAPKAFKLLTTAWEILREPDKRCAYHNRVGLPLPKLEKELHQGTKAEIMIDTAEKEFLHGHTVSAFKWATMAQELDPFFGSVNQYVEGYRIHIAALKKHRNGEIDWYNILGIEEDKCVSLLSQSITHQYVKLSKLINPDVHCSAAAPKAFKLLTTAWETLGEPDKRRAYHTRVGLPQPKSEKEQYDQGTKSRLHSKLYKPPLKRSCVSLRSNRPIWKKPHQKHRTATTTFIL